MIKKIAVAASIFIIIFVSMITYVLFEQQTISEEQIMPERKWTFRQETIENVKEVLEKGEYKYRIEQPAEDRYIIKITDGKEIEAYAKLAAHGLTKKGIIQNGTVEYTDIESGNEIMSKRVELREKSDLVLKIIKDRFGISGDSLNCRNYGEQDQECVLEFTDVEKIKTEDAGEIKTLISNELNVSKSKIILLGKNNRILNENRL